MKTRKHYYHGAVRKSVELTMGEQYQLMRDNQRKLKEQINWQRIFEDTVSFADININK